LVVTKLDRLARSLPDARAIEDELTVRRVRFNLGGSIYDPTDPVGRLLFSVLAMVAEFEADLIRLRTREGMKVAKAKGRLRGKQPKLNTRQEAHLVALLHAGDYSTAELADLFGVAHSTVYRFHAASLDGHRLAGGDSTRHGLHSRGGLGPTSGPAPCGSDGSVTGGGCAARGHRPAQPAQRRAFQRDRVRADRRDHWRLRDLLPHSPPDPARSHRSRSRGQLLAGHRLRPRRLTPNSPPAGTSRHDLERAGQATAPPREPAHATRSTAARGGHGAAIPRGHSRRRRCRRHPYPYPLRAVAAARQPRRAQPECPNRTITGVRDQQLRHRPRHRRPGHGQVWSLKSGPQSL